MRYVLVFLLMVVPLFFIPSYGIRLSKEVMVQVGVCLMVVLWVLGRDR